MAPVDGPTGSATQKTRVKTQKTRVKTQKTRVKTQKTRVKTQKTRVQFGPPTQTDAKVYYNDQNSNRCKSRLKHI
jgi:hypothetical protein